MAPLASIPEGSNSHPHSRFRKLNQLEATCNDKPRPQSRIFAASRRHSRSCYQRPAYPKPTWHADDNFFQPRPRDDALKTSFKSSFETIYNTPEVSSEEHVGPSDLSFSLDSFPVPPSTSSSSSHRDSGLHMVSGSSEAAFTSRTPKHYRKHPAVVSRRPCLDGGNDYSSSSHRVSVDSSLVDTITRNIVQQLRFSSVERSRKRPDDLKRAQTDRPIESQIPSKQDTLNRFAKDLEQYAKRRREGHVSSSCKGSLSTLHTVSALMPYRSEFRTAGLAVTSKDQANRIHSYITKAVEARAPEAGQSRKPGGQKTGTKTSKPSQMDGFEDTEPSESPNTEVSFAPSQGMDEWRYAMIDELPAKEKKKSKKKKKKAAATNKKKHCLSCFDHSPSTVTESGWHHFRKGPTAPVPKFRGGIGPPPAVPPPPVPPQRPPRPAVGLFDPEPPMAQQPAPDSITSSHPPSPRMLPARKHEQSKAKSPRTTRRGSPNSRALATNTSSSPPKRAKSSPRRARHISRPIPHETTSKQYTRRVTEPAPLDLKQAVEDAMNQGKDDKPNSTRPFEEACTIDHDHIGICCRGHRGIPSRAEVRPNIPRRTSSVLQLGQSSRLDYDDREITDRDVLRGLHIATSAACDEEVDAFVRNETGLRIRRFLADLITLETLAVSPPADKQQWARQRRADMRKLKQQMRRSREIYNVRQANRV